MEYTSQTQDDSKLGSDPLQSDVHAGRSERSLAASLRTIVRRVLRTKAGRNHFELRILDEAKRLLEIQRKELSRDALAKLIVDGVLQSRRTQPSLCTLGDDWGATQAATPASTFAL